MTDLPKVPKLVQVSDRYMLVVALALLAASIGLIISARELAAQPPCPCKEKRSTLYVPPTVEES